MGHIGGGLKRGLAGKSRRQDFSGFAQNYHLLDLPPQPGEEGTVISTFIPPAGNEDNGPIKMLQRANNGPDIRGFGVIEKVNAVDSGHPFQAMGQAPEVGQDFGAACRSSPHFQGQEEGGHEIFQIVRTRQGNIGQGIINGQIGGRAQTDLEAVFGFPGADG